MKRLLIFASILVFALSFGTGAKAGDFDGLGIIGLQNTASMTHIPQFIGDIYYVDPGQANDTGNGLSPMTAKKTYAAAIALAVSGDAIKIKAGTYTESFTIPSGKNGAELWFEVGALIDPVSGTAMTIAGNSCKIIGMHKITPANGAIGVLISGNENHIEHSKVVGGATGYSITGTGTMLENVASTFQTTTAYDIQGDQTRITYGKTMGNAATYGYKISNSADIGVLDHCTSVGHETAGYYIAIGSNNWTIKDSSSGADDGDRVDLGDDNMWANFFDTLRREYHAHVYPLSDGEGTAGDPITISTNANDESNGAGTTKDYWGEPMVVIPPAYVTSRWDFYGLNLYAETVDKAIRSCVYRIVHATRTTRAAGNAWDEGATVLTVADASSYTAADLVWITSSAYKSDGEIVRVTDVTGTIITIERETSQFGANNTGLRWNHSTNIGAGTLYIYLCHNTIHQHHSSCFDFSAGSKKDFTRLLWNHQRGMEANDGVVIRSQDGTDGTTCLYDVTAIYKD